MQRKRVQAEQPRKRSKPAEKRLSLYRTPAMWRGTGFPPRLKFKLRYVYNNTQTSTAGALDVFHICANGIYNPNTGGHQPLYFDEIMGIYNHWVVISSRIKLTASLDTNASTSGALLVVFLNDDNTVSPLDIRTLAEQSEAKCSRIAAVGNVNPTVVYNTYSAYKTFGSGLEANAALKGTAASNPSETSYYGISIQSHSGSCTVNWTAEIEYFCEFFELRDMMSS